MFEFNIGDVVMIKEDPSNISRVIDSTIEDTGRIIYKVEGKGYFYPEDLKVKRGENTKLKPKKKRIVLVTGGAGYAGSVLTRKLLQNRYKVVCLDSLRFGGASLVDVWDNPDFKFERLDITNYNDTDKVLESYDLFAIVHLAAIVGDPACKLEPDVATGTNRDASNHMLEKAVQLKIKKFIFSSTCSNYGRMKDTNGYVDETSPLHPVSLYAKLKVEFEDILLNSVEKDGEFSPTALRFATVYGVSPRMRFDLTVNEFTKELALGRELIVFGEQFWRPYCHVSDFANAIVTVLNAPQNKVAYKVFNVGDNSQNYTKKMIVDELVKRVADGRVKYVRKEEDPRDYRVKFDKIRDELGFKISKTVPEGIEDILTGIKIGIIENPDDQRYYNIPVGQDDAWLRKYQTIRLRGRIPGRSPGMGVSDIAGPGETATEEVADEREQVGVPKI